MQTCIFFYKHMSSFNTDSVDHLSVFTVMKSTRLGNNYRSSVSECKIRQAGQIIGLVSQQPSVWDFSQCETKWWILNNRRSLGIHSFHSFHTCNQIIDMYELWVLPIWNSIKECGTSTRMYRKKERMYLGET